MTKSNRVSVQLPEKRIVVRLVEDGVDLYALARDNLSLSKLGKEDLRAILAYLDAH